MASRDSRGRHGERITMTSKDRLLTGIMGVSIRNMRAVVTVVMQKNLK
jgi:hypothetical protein